MCYVLTIIDGEWKLRKYETAAELVAAFFGSEYIAENTRSWINGEILEHWRMVRNSKDAEIIIDGCDSEYEFITAIVEIIEKKNWSNPNYSIFFYPDLFFLRADMAETIRNESANPEDVKRSIEILNQIKDEIEE